MTRKEKANSIRNYISETTEIEIAKYSKEYVKNVVEAKITSAVHNQIDNILGTNNYFGVLTFKTNSPLQPVIQEATEEFIASYEKPVITLTEKEIKTLDILYRRIYLKQIKELVKITAMKNAETDMFFVIGQINTEVDLDDTL